MCKQDVKKCGQFDEGTQKFKDGAANYVAGPDDVLKCKDQGITIPGGTCCHHPEIASTLVRSVADEDFLPGCGSNGARDRCERYPVDEAGFCSRKGRERDGDEVTDEDDDEFEAAYAHCQCTFSEQFAESEPVEECTMDVPPPPPGDD
jgi:hypothetical protein